jgi:hypothetical protein
VLTRHDGSPRLVKADVGRPWDPPLPGREPDNTPERIAGVR